MKKGKFPHVGPYAPEKLVGPGEVFKPGEAGSTQDIVSPGDIMNPMVYHGAERIAGTGERIAGIWETISGWLDTILTWVGPLGELLDLLEQYGIITPTERQGAEGLTREEVARMIEEKYKIAAPSWQKYLPWIVTGGLGLGLIAALLARRKPVYIAER